MVDLSCVAMWVIIWKILVLIQGFKVVQVLLSCHWYWGGSGFGTFIFSCCQVAAFWWCQLLVWSAMVVGVYHSTGLTSSGIAGLLPCCHLQWPCRYTWPLGRSLSLRLGQLCTQPIAVDALFRIGSGRSLGVMFNSWQLCHRGSGSGTCCRLAQFVSRCQPLALLLLAGDLAWTSPWAYMLTCRWGTWEVQCLTWRLFSWFDNIVIIEPV